MNALSYYLPTFTGFFHGDVFLTSIVVFCLSVFLIPIIRLYPFDKAKLKTVDFYLVVAVAILLLSNITLVDSNFISPPISDLIGAFYEVGMLLICATTCLRILYLVGRKNLKQKVFFVIAGICLITFSLFFLDGWNSRREWASQAMECGTDFKREKCRVLIDFHGRKISEAEIPDGIINELKLYNPGEIPKNLCSISHLESVQFKFAGDIPRWEGEFDCIQALSVSLGNGLGWIPPMNNLNKIDIEVEHKNVIDGYVDISDLDFSKFKNLREVKFLVNLENNPTNASKAKADFVKLVLPKNLKNLPYLENLQIFRISHPKGLKVRLEALDIILPTLKGLKDLNISNVEMDNLAIDTTSIENLTLNDVYVKHGIFLNKFLNLKKISVDIHEKNYTPIIFDNKKNPKIKFISLRNVYVKNFPVELIGDKEVEIRLDCMKNEYDTSILKFQKNRAPGQFINVYCNDLLNSSAN